MLVNALNSQNTKVFLDPEGIFIDTWNPQVCDPVGLNELQILHVPHHWNSVHLSWNRSQVLIPSCVNTQPICASSSSASWHIFLVFDICYLSVDIQRFHSLTSYHCIYIGLINVDFITSSREPFALKKVVKIIAPLRLIRISDVEVQWRVRTREYSITIPFVESLNSILPSDLHYNNEIGKIASTVVSAFLSNPNLFHRWMIRTSLLYLPW